MKTLISLGLIALMAAGTSGCWWWGWGYRDEGHGGGGDRGHSEGHDRGHDEGRGR